MNTEIIPIDYYVVKEFITNFENEHPHITITISMDEVAWWLLQPHWKMYSDNLSLGIIDQKMYDKFMRGMFADWLLANQKSIVTI